MRMMMRVDAHMLSSIQTAIKKMKKKFYSWEECIQLREVKVQLHPAPV